MALVFLFLDELDDWWTYPVRRGVGIKNDFLTSESNEKRSIHFKK
jgi:hypothetical protein